MTAIESSKAVLVPALFVAVTVYVIAAEAAVGVPVMSPVDVSKSKPAGAVSCVTRATASSPTWS